MKPLFTKWITANLCSHSVSSIKCMSRWNPNCIMYLNIFSILHVKFIKVIWKICQFERIILQLTRHECIGREIVSFLEKKKFLFSTNTTFFYKKNLLSLFINIFFYYFIINFFKEFFSFKIISECIEEFRFAVTKCLF